MNHHTLHCLGVGDGAACGDRNHSASLYQMEDVCMLFDCGEPVSDSLKASGVNFESIDHVFVSHLHSDHFGGVFMLIQAFWLEKRRKEVVIHLPGDAIVPLRQMLTAAYLFDEMLSFELVFEPLEAGKQVVCNSWQITPYRTTHLEGFRKNFQGKYPGSYDAFCFSLQGNGCCVGHSADLGAVDDLGPLLTQPLDLLVCELAHFRAESLFEYLQGRDIKHLVFTHLDRRYWENFEETRQLAGQLLPGAQITFPRDREVIRF